MIIFPNLFVTFEKMNIFRFPNSCQDVHIIIAQVYTKYLPVIILYRPFEDDTFI